ncbi:crossover junction endonuclease EME1 [Aplysia californica]|uniref:Crossover junction endonuclease EME1 n=1 Tax=Aplysia californica TaxID=6500 RepID=A0ABM0JLM1_APLCA|nr:crossover junction endonuclease EME1 [Aplysia californica]XP_005096587.1 crossover junction endonuclease EME1 [Aplysia californica]
MFTVFVDPAAAPTDKRRQCITKACQDIGVNIDFVPQRVERTISWCPPLNAPPSALSDIQQEVVALLEAEEAVNMIFAHMQLKQGEDTDDISLTKWVESLQSALSGQNLTVIIIGLSKYFRKRKLNDRQQHRELVTGKPSRGRKKVTPAGPCISTEDAEEAFVDVQLFTGCVVQDVADDEELAAQLKFYTKAVRDKPAKKNRFESAFSFLDEGTSGLSVNKSGQGLAKVWKHQLMQFKNFSAEMADAVMNSYPSPQLLHQTCQSCSTAEAERLIGDINVRRSASVISTNRKIGKEHARRIHKFMTSTDSEEIVK